MFWNLTVQVMRYVVLLDLVQISKSGACYANDGYGLVGAALLCMNVGN
jgi:hypothetical protein